MQAVTNIGDPQTKAMKAGKSKRVFLGRQVRGREIFGASGKKKKIKHPGYICVFVNPVNFVNLVQLHESSYSVINTVIVYVVHLL